MFKQLWNTVRRCVPSLMKAEELYIVEGNHKEMIPVVKRELQELIADHGHIKQLRRCYALNWKPLRYVVNRTGECEYVASFSVINKHHKVHIGTEQLEGLKIVAKDGSVHPYSLKRLLVHEGTHAGQLSVYARTLKEDLAEMLQTQNIAFDKANPELVKWVQGQEAKAKVAGSYDEAKKLIEEAYDRFHKPRLEYSVAKVKQSKQVQKYLEKVEGPAIRNENEVARRLGEPERSMDYLHMQPVREDVVEGWLKDLGIAAHASPETPAYVKEILQQPKPALDPSRLAEHKNKPTTLGA